MKRARIGDIVEVPTKKGFSYCQYTHRVEGFSDLIQVKEGFFDNRPESFDNIIETESKIITFFPLRYAIIDKIFKVVDNLEVPARFQAFPTFRVRGINIKNGKAKEWWFWDGVNTWPERPVHELTEEQVSLPVKEIWNDTLLINNIESDYTPADDPTTSKSVLMS